MNNTCPPIEDSGTYQIVKLCFIIISYYMNAAMNVKYYNNHGWLIWFNELSANKFNYIIIWLMVIDWDYDRCVFTTTMSCEEFGTHRLVLMLNFDYQA